MINGLLVVVVAPLPGPPCDEPVGVVAGGVVVCSRSVEAVVDTGTAVDAGCVAVVLGAPVVDGDVGGAVVGRFVGHGCRTVQSCGALLARPATPTTARSTDTSAANVTAAVRAALARVLTAVLGPGSARS